MTQTRNVPRKKRRSPEPLPRATRLPFIAGVDEAGRGPWAGPVVAAAVILRRRTLSVRIDDSKRLTLHQRLRAYQAIVEQASIGIGIVPAELIDVHNIRQATLAAMAQAVSNLAWTPSLVLVDGKDAPPLSVPCQPIINGDQLSYPIACASIVAKVTRDALMEFYHRLFPAYQFDRHKGYGTRIHLDALKAHGPSPFHRMSFQPVQDVIREAAHEVLTEFPSRHAPIVAQREVAVAPAGLV